SNSHVSEEEPASDEALLGRTWGFLHDVQIWGVEAQGSGRHTVSDQVHPQQLDRDQGFGDAQGSDQVSDKLFHVVVNGTALLHSRHNGREVIISQHHLCTGVKAFNVFPSPCTLFHSCSRSHGNTNFSFLQGRGVIHTVTNLSLSLQVLHNLALVGRLHTGEEPCTHHSTSLIFSSQVIELTASVGQAFGGLILSENANSAADSLGKPHLIITSDDNDTDTSITASLDRVFHFLTRGIQHANHTDKSHVGL
ncbi:hypothetical protein EGW08_009330, partial [Elysia chlorotica]